MMAVNESIRLYNSLKMAEVPVRQAIINQILPDLPMETDSAIQLLRSVAITGEARATVNLIKRSLSRARARTVVVYRDAVEKADIEDARTALKTAEKDLRFMKSKRGDQKKAIEILKSSLPEIQRVREARLFDLEIRGVPALAFFGVQTWD